MKTEEILRRARKLQDARRASLADPRVSRVLGFLAAKRLLIVPGVTPRPRAKLPVEDVLHVGLHIEPRVMEVFPAAYIHSPSSFLHVKKMPLELRKIIRSLRRGEEEHEGFAGIEYRQMKRWVGHQAEKRKQRGHKTA